MARAQLDPELDKAYRLHVVLQVADNRLLTPIFQEQLQQALRNRLELSLGALANVEVVTNHPLLREIDAKGLETALDGWELLSSLKTHFVLVDFAAGVYSLRARQYDGMTGLSSPVVRRAQTSDRALVARTAARLVEQDFGLVGTVSTTGKEVQLSLKGGKLGDHLERWVKPGEVFAMSRITKEGDKLRGTRVPWALLEVIDAPRAGRCRCRLWHRFQEDDLLDLPGVLGYRCLKIATTSAPLKLRLVDDEYFRPLVGLQVHVLKPGDPKAAELTTNQSGLLVTRDRYAHLALVRVLAGDWARVHFPVAIIDDQTVVCPLKADADAEARAPLELRRDQWLRRILENQRLASERVALLNSELTKSMEQTLAIARAGLLAMTPEVSHLTLERDQILRLAREKSAKLDLREGEHALESLRGKRTELERFVTRIEAALKESTSPANLGLAKTLERARLYEAEADFDQAIALYDKVLKARPDQAKVKEHLAKLKLDWTPRNPRHADARAFLVKTWPRLEVADLKKNLAKAQEALAVCRDVDDTLTPLKVIQATALHAANLKKHLDALKSHDSADNPARAKDIALITTGLRQLHLEAAALAGTKKD